MSIQVEMNEKEFQNVLDRLIHMRDTQNDMSPVLWKCFPIIRRSLRDTFAAGGRPNKWPARWDALESVFPVLAGKAPLNASGHLRQGVIQGGATVLTKDSLFFGSNIEYAAKQHFGGPSTITVPQKQVKKVESDTIEKRVKVAKPGGGYKFEIKHIKLPPRKSKAGTYYVLMHGRGGWFAKQYTSEGTFTITIRPRPFMHLMPEDQDAILNVFRSEIMRGPNDPPLSGPGGQVAIV